MRVPPVENPVCAAFEEYGELPETVPLDFTEYDVTWVASKLSDAAGALGAETIELHNWFLHFGCASEELRVVVDRIADWMANPPLPLVPLSPQGAPLDFYQVPLGDMPLVRDRRTRGRGGLAIQ